MAKRVLVVEDNELNLKLFCDLLRAHDFAVEPVRDGREAVERTRAFMPDLIVMDPRAQGRRGAAAYPGDGGDRLCRARGRGADPCRGGGRLHLQADHLGALHHRGGGVGVSSAAVAPARG